jgi:glycosyltransferase involved in cell wall biosynthesis
VIVLHITASPLSLGFLRGQAAYMAASGVRLHVASSPGELLEAFGQLEGIPTHPVAISRSIRLIQDAAALFTLVRLFRRLKPDIVHAHTPKAGLLGMIAAFAAAVPGRIYHLRGLPSSTASGMVRWVLIASERLTCRLAHRVLCVSDSLRQEAVDGGICSGYQAMVISQGSGQGVDAAGRFDPGRFSAHHRRAMRSKLGIPEGAVVVGFVGRLTLDKGLRVLQCAWDELKERHPSLHLVLAGAADDRAPLPSELQVRFAQDPRVHHTGWASDAPAIYPLLDIVTLPSFREGFSNVVLETGAMGLPVVATWVTGCVDAVIPGKTGELVPPGDAGALADAISAYVLSPDRRQEHGSAARVFVREHFRPEVIWKGILDVYMALAAASPGARALAGDLRADSAAGMIDH